MKTTTPSAEVRALRRGPEVGEELAAEHGLSALEYRRLCDGLGRPPSHTELGIVSVMWSEHCSYKSSRVHLKTLPTDGPRVIQGPGENAGVVDIGDGQAVVFKMESHNHPSFLEPYQGAATGVGGICRDVFTMGARPIALADCLRFGDPHHPKTAHLLNGVVAGVGGYGNSFGVPNVNGDVSFDASYNGNILVNAFCLGIAESDRIFKGFASGTGNPILYVGARTGRDGIHGATMASAEFAEGAEEKRPAVQVGDPFMEKLLLEACLELMQSDCLVGIQDMGAAGLTSSAVEMAARAGSGVEIELERVPQRETGMTPYELCLSESQERMLMVVESGREEEVLAIFEKWDLDAAVIGRVTDSGRVVFKMDGEIYADLPADLLAEGLVYERPSRRPEYLAKLQLDRANLADITDPRAALLELVGSANLCSREWVYRQYDSGVRHATVLRPGQAGAGVVRVRTADGAREKGVAIAAGCNSRMVYLDPYNGSKLAVLEAYANLAAVGAEALAVTDCLNFGNPEKPEVMWQLIESVRGLGDACVALETPIVSGNVSLYNETDGVAIKPTPMIAMVGLLETAASALASAFAAPGAAIAVIGAACGSLDGSEFLAHEHKLVGRELPSVDLDVHRRTCDAVRELVRGGRLDSARDISRGGLLVALSDCCLGGRELLGAAIRLPTLEGRLDEYLFGEGPGRFVVSFDPARAGEISGALAGAGVPFLEIGTTGGATLEVSLGNSPPFAIALADLGHAWRAGLADIAQR